MGGIDRKAAGEILLPVAAQGRRIDVGAGAVAAFEPHHAPQALFVAVKRIDEVFETQVVLAGPHVDGEPQAGRIAQRADADQRVGIDRAGETPAGDVVDRVEDGDFAVVIFALGFEHFDRQLDHVAQTGALAFREVADGVVDVLGGIAVTGEDRFVDIQRVDVHLFAADIGVGEESVVKNLRQFPVGNDLVAGAGSGQNEQEHAEGYADNTFHSLTLDFIMLRTVIFEITQATAPKAASTAARSPGRNSTG